MLLCDVQGNDWTFRQRLTLPTSPPIPISPPEPEVEEVMVNMAVVTLVIDIPHSLVLCTDIDSIAVFSSLVIFYLYHSLTCQRRS